MGDRETAIVSYWLGEVYETMRRNPAFSQQLSWLRMIYLYAFFGVREAYELLAATLGAFDVRVAARNSSPYSPSN